jgi:hypothetical protein
LRILVRFVEPSREGSNPMLSPAPEYKNPLGAAPPKAEIESQLLAGRSLAYCFEFDSSTGILRCRLAGDVTDESLQECYEVAGKYAARTNPGVGIMDFSNVASFNVSSQTVRDLASRTPRMPGSRPRVLVAPSTQIYGLARMFQEIGSEARPEVHVVRSLDEAYTLLGVREPQFEPVEEVLQNATENKSPFL